MSENAFHKTVCTGCGVHVEYPTEAEGQSAPCPKCGNDVLLKFSHDSNASNERTAINEMVPQGGSATEWKVPHFIVEPQDARIFEGEFVFFKAKAKGVPNPSYQWFVVDHTGSGRALPGETNPELAIPNASIGTTRYVVRAINRAGDVQSRVASLLVRPQIKQVLDSDARNEMISEPNNIKSVNEIERQRRLLEAEKEQARINSASQATPSPKEISSKKEHRWSWGEICAFIVIFLWGLCGAVTFASKVGKISDYTNAQWNIWPKMPVLADALLTGGFLLCLYVALDSGKRARAASINIGSCLLLIVIGIKYYPSFNPSPQQTDVDYGVNWSLSHSIQRTETKSNLFNSYRINNQYNEKVGSEKHFVYDFEAQCPVVFVNLADDGHPIYRQANGASSSMVETISGSVTLVRKGQTWYCSNTVRVH